MAKFITFQPKKVVDEINKNGVYEASLNPQLIGKENKIFCLTLDENIMERIFLCAPSMPQTAIIFETEEYTELDSIVWVNKLFLGIDKEIDSKYKEYTVEKIDKSQLIRVINISDSKDPDEVQDDFMDKHFMILEKLSGYKWDRVCDKPELVMSPLGNKLFESVTLVMMPFREVTEDDFDNTVELIRNLFRKHSINKISVDDICKRI